jgi:hypothetical protein
LDTRTGPVEIDLKLEPVIGAGGDQLSAEDLAQLYFAALNPPANQALITSLSSLPASNPFATTMATSGNSDMFPLRNGDIPPGSTTTTTRSSSPLLAAMFAMAGITVLAFVGVYAVREKLDSGDRDSKMMGGYLPASQTGSAEDDDETEIVFSPTSDNKQDDSGSIASSDEGSLFIESFLSQKCNL